MILFPQILTHPNIPDPLHGINPRTIMGEDWWNIKRKQVYNSTKNRCICCGVHKSEAKGPKWLEAHEYWDFNFQTGRCEVKAIIPLCHYCHNFIHSGRLGVILGKEKTKEEVISILEHGFRLLSLNNLKVYFKTYELALKLNIDTLGVEPYQIEINPNLKWSDYYLIFEGKEYKSKFASEKEWKAFYSNKNE